jgi:hypothetical protein
MDICSEHVYNLCMMLIMVKEADLDRIEVPEDCEVLDATALGRRLGFKRDRCSPTSLGGTSAAYLAPIACLLWGLSGTRRASKGGKRRKTKRVASRSANNEFESRGEG